MNDINESNDFKYTYSAEEQEEIRRIRQKYQVREEDNMSKIRKLDAAVTQKANRISLTVGIIGSLIMGTGMSLIMTELSTILGMTVISGMIVGMIIGIAGIVFVVLAYPIYQGVIKKEREKIAPEILRLTEELMK